MMSRAPYLKIWEQRVPGAQHTGKGSPSPALSMLGKFKDKAEGHGNWSQVSEGEQHKPRPKGWKGQIL